MKIIKVKTSLGCLGKNIGCDKAPDAISDDGESVKITGNVEEINKNIEKSDGDFYIGGDHSISYGSFKGFAKKFKNPGLIIFDAHPDIYPEDFVNHENWVYWLIKEGVLKKENLIYLGLNAVDKKEQELIDKWWIKCELDFDELEKFDGIYLSLDIDVLNIKYGTGYPQGKMGKKEFFSLIRKLKTLKNLKRIDLVEVNPDKDKNREVVKIAKEIFKVFS